MESKLIYNRLREMRVETGLHLIDGAGHTLINAKSPPSRVAGAKEVQ